MIKHGTVGAAILTLCLVAFRAEAAGLVAELRVGLLDHATELTTSGRENGIDINAELRFRTLPWLGGPAPYLGLSASADSDQTDQIYTGLGWRWRPRQSLLLGLGVGLAVHNGEILRINRQRRGLGNRVLLHGALEAGWRIGPRLDLALYYQHISNGPIHGERGVNDGLDNAGLRLGYRF